MNFSPFSMSAFRLCLSISLWGREPCIGQSAGAAGHLPPNRVLSLTSTLIPFHRRRGESLRVVTCLRVSKDRLNQGTQLLPSRPHPTKQVTSMGKGLHGGHLPFSTHGLACSTTQDTLEFKGKLLFYNQTQSGEKRRRKCRTMPMITA